MVAHPSLSPAAMAFCPQENPARQIEIPGSRPFIYPLHVKNAAYVAHNFDANLDAVQELLTPLGIYAAKNVDASGKALVQLSFLNYKDVPQLGGYQEFMIGTVVSARQGATFTQDDLGEMHAQYREPDPDGAAPEDVVLMAFKLVVNTERAQKVGEHGFGTDKILGTIQDDHELLDRQFSVYDAAGERILTLQWGGSWLEEKLGFNFRFANRTGWPRYDGNDLDATLAHPNDGDPEYARARWRGKMWFDPFVGNNSLDLNADTSLGRLLSGLDLQPTSVMGSRRYSVVLCEPHKTMLRP